MTHFLNGKFVPEGELVVSVRDLGFSRGYAVFDFFITYGGRPFMLDRHIDRLFGSAKLIGLSIPWSKAQVKNWVEETLRKNNDGLEKAVKIIVSGGVSQSLLPSGDPTIAIVVDERHAPPQEYLEKGVGLISVKHTRYAPEAKTNNYIEGVKQAQIAKAEGALEPVYYDDHQVFETSNSNIFVVINNELLTPATHILHGITCQVLFEILKLDIPVKTQDFSIEQLRSATEVFITGSSKEIIPVTVLDGTMVGDGTVGLTTQEVLKQFREFTKNGRW